MKPDKIREMSPDELRGKERELQEQLFRLRFQKSLGQLDNALKLRGVPVKMIVFPRQHHGLTEPKMRMRAAQSSVEWIEKWIPR